MPSFTCTRCLKTFDRAYNLDRHLTRNRKCKVSDKINSIDEMEKEAVDVSLKVKSEGDTFSFSCCGLTYKQLQNMVNTLEL